MNRGRIGMSAISIGAILVAKKKRMAGKGYSKRIGIGKERGQEKGAGEGDRRTGVKWKKGDLPGSLGISGSTN